jgi:hypothetical protein
MNMMAKKPFEKGSFKSPKLFTERPGQQCRPGRWCHMCGGKIPAIFPVDSFTRRAFAECAAEKGQGTCPLRVQGSALH